MSKSIVAMAVTVCSIGGLAVAFAQSNESADAFRTIAPVFQSPRCMNCHTITSFPRQGDDRHRHTMNVARGKDGHGMPALQCSACHQRANQSASGVPGADEDWHLAPLSMGWEGLSVSQLCSRLLDPVSNGGRSRAAVIEHLSTNLVKWAWDAGLNGKGMLRGPPPLAYNEFIQLAKRWIETGARCPI